MHTILVLFVSDDISACARYYEMKTLGYRFKMGNWVGRRGEMQRLQTPVPDFVEPPKGTAIYRFLIFVKKSTF